MTKIERDVRPNQVEFDYPTMTDVELRDFAARSRRRPQDWKKILEKFQEIGKYTPRYELQVSTSDFTPTPLPWGVDHYLDAP